MPRKGEFPTRENCDPTNPEEAFLWCFAALPHVRGAPLIMPIEYYREVSQRLWDLGARPTAEPTLEWVPPTASEPHWLTSPGRWVPVGEAPKITERQQVANAVENMSMIQKAELITVLENGEPFPDTPSGRVAGTLSPDQQQLVLSVLKELRGA